MDLKSLVKAIKKHLGKDKAEYINIGTIRINDTRIVVIDTLVKAGTLTVRCSDPKALLKALKHDGIMNVPDETINKILHDYNIRTNPFIKTKKQPLNIN